MTKKEKLIEKFVKKDYNDKLEEVLTKKIYSEEVQNLLLDIMYKIEMSYKDYETVKKNVVPQEQYIENLISIIQKNCDEILFIRPAQRNTKNIEVNKEEKKIICYPITTKLLYSLAKIQKSDNILNQESSILNKCFTDMINIGNNINMVEPLRDFNGYSWSVSLHEIENFYYNLIYQNLILLVGNEFIEEWVKCEDKINYTEAFQQNLINNYGIRLAKEIWQLLVNISILLETSIDKDFQNKMSIRKKEIEKNIKEMANREKYILNLSKNKKELTREIRNLDMVINDRELLTMEYEKRNKNLPLEEKIFSKRVLKIQLQEERNAKIELLKKCNYKMNSKNFINDLTKIKLEQRYLEIATTEDNEKKLIGLILMLQKRTLQAIRIRIKKAKEKEEIIKIIYEIRYLNLVPINETMKIGQIPRMKKLFQITEDEAIEKAYELKVLNEFAKNSVLNNQIIEYIFSLNIIRMEDISLKIIKEKDREFIQFYDDNIEDERFEIDLNIKKEELKIKFNRKVEVFI